MTDMAVSARRAPSRSVALFFKGPQWDERLPLDEQAAFAEHAAFMQRLAREGHVTDSGPFHEPAAMVPGTEVGLAVFASGDPREVLLLLADDPVVVAGSMQYRLHPWHLRPPSSAAEPGEGGSPQ